VSVLVVPGDWEWEDNTEVRDWKMAPMVDGVRMLERKMDVDRKGPREVSNCKRRTHCQQLCRVWVSPFFDSASALANLGYGSKCSYVEAARTTTSI
jgi:hypothetical protein